jgi:cell division protein ZapA (FtsZ GTPase activity inhibitor)
MNRMDDKLSIKLTIGNRQYPLSINRDEEEGIRKAASQINDKIKEFREAYAVRDMEDLLAMTALHFAVGEKKRSRKQGDGSFVQSGKAAEIDSMLTDYLGKL